MCKLGGLWKKKGDRHFECGMCGETRRGWRTWFMVPWARSAESYAIPEGKKK